MLRNSCLHAALAAAIALSPLCLLAQGAHDADHSALPLTSGVVRKVDKETGKVTIRHEAIRNLDMPPMSMVFRVEDPAMLERLKPGDKIRFAADKVDGAFTVMRFEPAQ